MKCRICDTDMSLIEVLRNKEQNVTTLYNKPYVGNRKEISLYRCPFCTHMQIEYDVPNDYYEDYSLISEPSKESEKGRYSPSVIEYYKQKFAYLAEHAISHNRILDIGCGAGILLEYEEQYFNEVLGVEPSRVQYSIAKKLGKNVVNAYFSEELELEAGFSAFVSTQVFEHITCIHDVLRYAWQLLEKGGVGLVEVPNGQKMYQEQSYYDVFPDHVNYYTPLSLCTLARKNGFEVISVSEEFNRNHMSLYVRKPFKEHCKMEKVIKEDRTKLNNMLVDFKKISVWGMGAKARSFIQLINDKTRIIHFWDINAMTWNKYLDSTNIPISKPQKNEILESDCILIFAAAYTEEIIETCKRYGYTGKIIRFDGDITLETI